MKKHLLALLCFSCPLLFNPALAAMPPVFPQVQKPQRTLNFRVLPVANLFYQLDCMAGQGHCSQSAFQDLWRTTLKWNPTDTQALEHWKALKTKYSEQLYFPPQSPSALPQRFEGIDIWKKIRIASLNAKSLPHLQEELGLLMLPADAAKLTLLVEHFWPRFEAWWSSGPEQETQTQARAFAQLLQRDDISDLMRRVESFYQAQFLGHQLLSFNILFRPKGGGQNTNGEQLENHSLIEVLEGRKAEEIVDVVLHELCHYLYRSSSEQEHVALLNKVAQKKDARATGAFFLMNEGLATAVGNGLVKRILMPPDKFKRYFVRPKSFYNDPYIDLTAKGILEDLNQALKSGQTLGDDFLDRYLNRTQQILGAKLLSPQVQLKEFTHFKSPALEALTPELYRTLYPRSVWGNTFSSQHLKQTLAQNPAQNVMIWLTPQDTPTLSEGFSEWPTASKNWLQSGRTGWVILPKNQQSFVYVLKARSVAEGQDLLKALGQHSGAPGIYELQGGQLKQMN